jgi:hypothetical protein
MDEMKKAHEVFAKVLAVETSGAAQPPAPRQPQQ